MCNSPILHLCPGFGHIELQKLDPYTDLGVIDGELQKLDPCPDLGVIDGELQKLDPCPDLGVIDGVPILYLSPGFGQHDLTLGFYPYFGVHLLSGYAVPSESSVGLSALTVQK